MGGIVYLTEQNHTPSKDGQAGAEIEITPEMMEAGGLRIQDQCGEMPLSVASTIAREVFLEMIQTKYPTGLRG